MARFSNVVFTWNNPDSTIEFDPETMGYLCYQEEVGETGTYHFQGYCEFAKRVRLTTAKEILGQQVHFEIRRGTQAQAIAYCHGPDYPGKTGIVIEDTFVEFGTKKKQGERVDLDSFKEAVFEGAKMLELLDQHCEIIARYPKFYSTLKMMLDLFLQMSGRYDQCNRRSLRTLLQCWLVR